MSGALLTEVVFSYPGQGYLLVKAVLAQDFPLMQGLFLVITLSVLLANLLVDILYWFWIQELGRAPHNERILGKSKSTRWMHFS